jgi:hypothetical protein
MNLPGRPQREIALNVINLVLRLLEFSTPVFGVCGHWFLYGLLDCNLRRGVASKLLLNGVLDDDANELRRGPILLGRQPLKIRLDCARNAHVEAVAVCHDGYFCFGVKKRAAVCVRPSE